MASDSLEKRILAIENELRAMKGASRKAPLIRCYNYRVSAATLREFFESHTGNIFPYLNITYHDGNNAIITEVSAYTVMPYPVAGNSQKFGFGGYDATNGIQIISTRPIASVQIGAE